MADECIPQTHYNFSVWDWVVFGALFLISALIGAYFAFRSRNKADDTDDYLLGGRKMSAIPVSFSLTASFMSAITVLGTPAEFYTYGTMFTYFLVAYTVVMIITSEMYIPMFYKLGITSTYEYLEMRFNRSVRMFATATYIVNTVLYVGIVIYAPALALNEVSDLGLWWSVALTGAVCTIYTTLGGLKAVVWTDVFQCIVMWIGFVAAIIVGTSKVGGFDQVWSTAEENDRIQFNHFEFDYKIRHTFWSISVGGTILWTGTYSVSQTMVQRYLSCKTLNHAKASVWLNLVGLYIIVILTGLSGLVMYAYYSTCDPYSAGYVNASDQLMPYFVLEILHDYPGLPGVYVCSAFSGSLSTVSSGINGMATVTLQDFILPYKKFHPKISVVVSKVLVVVYGIICVGMAWVASKLGGVLQAALSINGIISGPMLALFTHGLLFPWTNSYGALAGIASGLACSTWAYVGSTIYPPAPEYIGKLEVSTDGCCFNENSTTPTYNDFTGWLSTTMEPDYPPTANLYAMSYLYYGTFGFCVNIVVGIIVSFLTGYQKPSKVNPKTIWAFFDHPIFNWLPKRAHKALWCGVKHGDEDKDFLGAYKGNDIMLPEKSYYYSKSEIMDEEYSMDDKYYKKSSLAGMENPTFNNISDEFEVVIEDENEMSTTL